MVGRSGCGFVGLKNAGATCYMNSVLQQLYMTPPIREVSEGVWSWSCDSHVTGVLYFRLFLALRQTLRMKRKENELFRVLPHFQCKF